ncbi:MAG: hypothetical protein NTW98_02260, partial [Candidatus Nomurabacteria bacterium]|nr:hypothetical protein [Candidatus Nomurabacteria bacterium]
ITTATPVGIYTYSISCSNAAGVMSASSTVTVEVTAPTGPSVSVNFLPDLSPEYNIPVPNTGVTLLWTSTGSTGACDKTYTVNGVSATPPTGWVNAASNTNWSTGNLALGTYTYTVQCPGPGGSFANDTATVNVTTTSTTSVSSVNFTPPVPTSVQAGNTITLAWTSSSTVANTCDRTDGFGTWATMDGPFNGSSGVLTAPAFSATGNNSYTFTITCDSVAGATTPTATNTISVNVTSQPVSSVTFTNPSTSSVSVQAGNTINLTWTSSGTVANTCNRTGSFSTWATTNGPVGGSVTLTAPTTTGSYVLKIKCTGVPGATQAMPEATVTVTVTPLPFVTISAAPNPVAANGTTKISWTTSNVGTCAKSGAVSTGWPNVHTTDSWTTLPLAAGSYTFTITCNNPVVGATPASFPASVTVNVLPPPVVTISASPVTVEGKTTISWTTDNVGTCTKSGAVSTGWPNVHTTGSWTTPQLAVGTYTFIISCANPIAGATPANFPASVIVKVELPTVTITASPASVSVGGTSLIHWESTGATSCTKSSGSTGWSTNTATSGDFPTPAFTSAGTVPYTIFCTGPLGTTPVTSAYVTITPNPEVIIKVNGLKPHNVTVNNSIIDLSWNAINTTSTCNASTTITSNNLSTNSTLWSGPQSPTGSVSKAIAAGKLYAFKISCAGINGAAVSDTVTVTYAIPPTVDLKVKVGAGAFSDGPVDITSTSSITLNWSSTNTTGFCDAITTKQPTSSGMPWSGKKATPGTSAVISNLQPGTSYTFTLTCSGPGGSA